MDNSLIPLNELQGLGEVFVKSGFFADSRDASQAIVKILAGRELGFGPIASMTGVYIVNGRPALSASLIAARIKSSGKYDYRVREHDEKHCVIEFFQINGAKESLGVSSFTMEDARRANTKNLDKFPRNMLFARSLTNGARWYCPDVFSGAIYTPDELGAEVGEDGDVIPGEARVIVEKPAAATKTDSGQAIDKTVEAPKPEPSDPLPGYVNPAATLQVPSHSRGNGNGSTDKVVRAVVQTPKWPELIQRAIQAGYVPDTTTPSAMRLLTVVGKAGIQSVNNLNLDEVWKAISAHYEAKREAEALQNN